MEDRDLPGGGDAYERPSAHWQCNHADGSRCWLGPNHLGVCGATPDCIPQKKEDRWICNRSHHRGGPCTNGPTPQGKCSCALAKCSPQRSLRGKRGVFTLCVVALTLGGLTLFLNTPARQTILMPGPLSSHHANVMSAIESEGCATCHPGANRSTGEWFLASVGFGPVANGHTTQTEQCLQCHQDRLSKSTAKLAHNLPTAWLANVTTRLSNEIANNEASPPGRFVRVSNERGELACSTCHREHHGRQHSLDALTNNQCQACHVKQFASFEDGHPEFSTRTRRRGIRFDHQLHESVHFRKNGRSFQCRDCHYKDETTHKILPVVSYDACKQCHDKPINISLAAGVPIIQLPILDTDVFEDAGLDIGQWPVQATGDFDGQLPPVMKLLLASDADARAALANLGDNFDFYDLDIDDTKQLQDAAELVWSIKVLLRDLAKNPLTTWQSRLQSVLGMQIEPTLLNHLHLRFSQSFHINSALTWFNDLDADLRLGHPMEETSDSAQLGTTFHPAYEISRTDAAIARTNAWEVDHETYSLSYIPAGHDDPFLAALLDVLNAGVHSSSSPLIEESWMALSQPSSIGRCLTCHSIDDPTGVTVIHWNATEQGSMDDFGLTRFSHAKHISQSQLADCQHCHQSTIASSGSTTESGNASMTSSCFTTVSKLACATCHNAKTGNDTCTLCHDYHAHSNEVQPSSLPEVAERYRQQLQSQLR